MYMCHLVNLAEDKSYAAQERSRFRPEYIFLPDKISSYVQQKPLYNGRRGPA